MILAIDIGNTNVVFGIFDNDNLITTKRLLTIKSDAKQYYLDNLPLTLSDYSFSEVLLVSVVPDLTVIFKEVFLRLYRLQINVFTNDINLGINYLIDNKDKLGNDLSLGVYAAYKLYGLPVAVCDLGTASTICVLDTDLNYLGGIIVPGVNSSFNSLIQSATLLKGFELGADDISLLPKNTKSALNSGMYYFTIGGITYYYKLLEEYLGQDLKLVMTGGISNIYSSFFKDYYLEPDLLLKGLYFVYKNNLFQGV